MQIHKILFLCLLFLPTFAVSQTDISHTYNCNIDFHFEGVDVNIKCEKLFDYREDFEVTTTITNLTNEVIFLINDFKIREGVRRECNNYISLDFGGEFIGDGDFHLEVKRVSPHSNLKVKLITNTMNFDRYLPITIGFDFGYMFENELKSRCSNEWENLTFLSDDIYIASQIPIELTMNRKLVGYTIEQLY